jgi:hypothetical protein
MAKRFNNKSHFPVLAGLGLIILCLAIFTQTWHHDFILYDDPLYVVENIHVHGLTMKNMKWAFSTFHAGFYIPVTWLSFMLDFQIYWLNPSGYHMTNLLFHIANTLLLFYVLGKMTNGLWRSAMVSALFAVHPLHVESVAWITERKDVLSAFFWIWALLSYFYYTKEPNFYRYLVVCLFFILGLLSKPVVVTLPFVLLLLDFWPLNRFSSTSIHPDEYRPPPRTLNNRFFGHPILEKLPLLVFSVASGILTIMAHGKWRAVMPFETLPLPTRLGNAMVSYVTYMTKTMIPWDLAVFYPHPGNTTLMWKTAGAGCILCLLSFLILRLVKKSPYLTVGWFWFLGTLIPVIGLIQAGEQARADRFTYLPLIGLFLMGVWGIPQAIKGLGNRRLIIATASLLSIGTFTIISYEQTQTWRNSITLFSHAIASTHENYLAHNHLGKALGLQKKYSDAMVQFKEALRIHPRYSDAHNNMGAALAHMGQFQKAIDHYQLALALNPTDVIARMNLGMAFFRTKKFEESIPQFRAALREDPHIQQAHYYLALSHEAQGDRDSALGEYQVLNRMNPNLAKRLLRVILCDQP